MKRASRKQPLDSQRMLMRGVGGEAPAHSHLPLVLHVGQLHILLIGGGWRWFQVAADHELIHEDTRDGTQEWGDDGHPPPVAAGPGGRQMWSGTRGTGQRGDGLAHPGGDCTHVKTSEPQPAMAVKRRGPKSRAGLTA